MQDEADIIYIYDIIYSPTTLLRTGETEMVVKDEVWVDSRQFGTGNLKTKMVWGDSSMCYNFEHDMKAIPSFVVWLRKHRCP